MSSAATIIFAREDLVIPGATESATFMSGPADAAHSHFFKLVNDSKPDAIVLDFTRASRSGADTILTIRQRTNIPILVVCNAANPSIADYRSAGANCIPAPVDIPFLGQAVQKIIRATRRAGPMADVAGLPYETPAAPLA